MRAALPPTWSGPPNPNLTSNRSLRHDSDNVGPVGPARRTVLVGLFALPACVPEAPPASAPPPAVGDVVVLGWTVPTDSPFEARRDATLQAILDALLPADPSDPDVGARAADAIAYVRGLLTAFLHDPPRIFVGGPYSGRHGGLPGFSSFQTLTRVETLRWQTYLLGSQGFPERSWNGPVVGLRDRLDSFLDLLEADSVAERDAPFSGSTLPERRTQLAAADADTVAEIYALAVEGTYGDPAYGGNRDGVGWRVIDYEGDRLPRGYTAWEMSHGLETPPLGAGGRRGHFSSGGG